MLVWSSNQTRRLELTLFTALSMITVGAPERPNTVSPTSRSPIVDQPDGVGTRVWFASMWPSSADEAGERSSGHLRRRSSVKTRPHRLYRVSAYQRSLVVGG